MQCSKPHIKTIDATIAFGKTATTALKSTWEESFPGQTDIMKRARRRSAASFGQQSDVSYSDTDEYQPRSGSVVPGERCSSGDRQKAELR